MSRQGCPSLSTRETTGLVALVFRPVNTHQCRRGRVRYTLEALLLTQAMRTRDYDPGRTPADPVLALYLPGQAVATPASAENVPRGDGDDDDPADTRDEDVFDEDEEGTR